jgi:multidrug efflux pump subunit AcrA (membrane-fusion protein)
MKHRRAQSAVRWIITFALLTAVVGAIGYGVYQYARPVVTVTEVVEGPVVQAFYSTGTIEPEREYPIKSNTAGTITEVRVDKGDHVTKGQPLAVVTDPALLYTVDKTQAELDEKLHRADEKTSPVLLEFDARLKGSQELLDIAQREVKRVTDLMQNNAGAQNDLDRAMDRVKQLVTDSEAIRAQKEAKKLELQREVDVARSALNIAKWNLEQQTLKSPIDGVVLDRPTPIGTRVAVNDPILRVADVTPTRLVMRADVDEEDIAKVNIDQNVRLVLYAFSGQVFSGKVTKIYDQADESRRTFEVDVKLDLQNERLQPGMTGELAFVVATRDRATVIPSQALQGGNVYVVRDDRIERAQVNVGLRSIERIEILSGLEPGTHVVITPATTMNPGQVVRTKYMDPVAAAGLNKPPPITEAFKAFGH